MEASSFQFTFYGEGYTEEQDTSQEKPSAKIRTRVQGPGNLKLRVIKDKILSLMQSPCGRLLKVLENRKHGTVSLE